MIPGAVSPEDIRRRRRKPPLLVDQDVFYPPRLMIATRLDPASATSTNVTGNGTIATNTSSGTTVHGARIYDRDWKGIEQEFIPYLQRQNLPALKFYFEVKVNHFAGGSMVGFGVGGVAFGGGFPIFFIPDPTGPFGITGAICYLVTGHIENHAGYGGLTLGALTDNDVVGVALAMRQSNNCWFRKVSGTPSGWNDPSSTAADPTIAESGIPSNGGIVWATFGGTSGAINNALQFNFSGPFVGSIPDGYGVWDAAQVLGPALTTDIDSFSIPSVIQPA